MDIQALSKFNTWWVTGTVKKELLFTYKRLIYNQLLKFINDRQIILLTGLRRVGKTVLMFQLIDTLLEKGIDKKNILYFSFDEGKYELKEVIETYRDKILKQEFGNEKIYIFLDEVQKAENWTNQIKIFYDLFPGLKFFLSGSAGLVLQKKTRESLAGRIFELTLEPLSFSEFLGMKNIKIEFEDFMLYHNKISPMFFDYIRKSGFPEIIDEKQDEKIKLYIKNSIIDRIIYKDLPLEFGIKDLELLETLVRVIFTEPGMIINFDNLARNLRRDKKTIMNYIFYLKYGLLIRVLFNFRKGVLVASRKFKKAYPVSPAFVFSSADRFYEQDFFGKVLETFVVNEIGAKYYYRKNGEVDVIWQKGEKIIPVEIKSAVRNDDIKAFQKTMDKLNLKEGIIVTTEQFEKIKTGNKKISLIPAWAFVIFKENLLNKKS
jgi:predicted AAA+ superfamily ATPase